MMKSIKLIMMFIGMALSLNSMAQNKACTGQDYSTNATYFRVSSKGASMDITASKKKALSNARNSIVTLISSKVQEAINKQSCEDIYKKKMMELSMIAIRQQVANIKTICENSNQVNQKYESNVVVELAKENIIKSITAQISNDNTLKDRFNIDKFKNSL